MEANRPAIVPAEAEPLERPDSTRQLSELMDTMLGILEHLKIAIATFDMSGGCEYCSPLITDMLCFCPRNLNELITALSSDTENKERVVEMIEAAQKGEPTDPIEVQLPGSLSESLFCRVEFITREIRGTTQLIVIVKEITDEMDARKDIEQLSKNAMLGEIAAGAAHELNNNLTSVLGWTQIARQNAEDYAKASDALTIIEENTQKARRIFSRILDASTEGGDEECMTCVSPVDIVEDTLQLLSLELRNAGIKVTQSFDDVGFCYAHADQIEQVLANLIRNAMDAMTDGGELHVMVTQEGDKVEIAVADNGQGIEPKNLERIFESFFTTKSRSDTKTSGGVGLGLSVSQEILKDHGGSIRVKSKPGQGTCFTVVLPLADRDTEPSLEVEPPSRGTIPPGVVVLVVDDEPDIGEMVRTSLELKGACVHAVQSGEQAVSECGKTHFDAAFVDFTMPGLSGHELVKEILAVQPDLPIIYMSGFDVENHGTMTDFLKKPFDLDDIQERLRHVLKLSKAH